MVGVHRKPVERAGSSVLLHMRARPNLMMQTLDDVGGLVASRLHDRMQAYAGVCARVRYRREPMKRQKAQKAMTQIVIRTMILMGYPGGMVLMSF